MRLRAVLGALLVFAMVTAPAARAAEEDTSQLSGYVAGAAGWAVSFQPFIPALLPTGDAPFETTVSLSTANVTSGGNSLGRAAIFWPGSAAANLGPLLGTGANQPFVGSLVPPYPGFVEASAKDGERVRAVGPVASMRAFGAANRSEGDVRTPDLNVPGVLRIDSVSSRSIAEVTDVDVTSSAVVDLEGVNILDGTITARSIHSRSLTRSTGQTGVAEGNVQVVGLTVAGIAAELTADGIKATGLPPEAAPVPGATAPFPGSNPDTQLNAAMAALGVTIKLTRAVDHVNGATADRLANAVVISIVNPAFEGSHLDFTLAATGSTAQASPVPGPLTDVLAAAPNLEDFSSLDAPLDIPGVSPEFASSPISDLALGPAPDLSGAGAGDGGGTGLDTELTAYRFGGVPISMIVLGLLAAVVIARWLRTFLTTRLLS